MTGVWIVEFYRHRQRYEHPLQSQEEALGFVEAGEVAEQFVGWSLTGPDGTFLDVHDLDELIPDTQEQQR
jgi:hypothetical protein